LVVKRATDDVVGRLPVSSTVPGFANPCLYVEEGGEVTGATMASLTFLRYKAWPVIVGNRDIFGQLLDRTMDHWRKLKTKLPDMRLEVVGTTPYVVKILDSRGFVELYEDDHNVPVFGLTGVKDPDISKGPLLDDMRWLDTTIFVEVSPPDDLEQDPDAEHDGGIWEPYEVSAEITRKRKQVGDDEITSDYYVLKIERGLTMDRIRPGLAFALGIDQTQIREGRHWNDFFLEGTTS